MKLTDKRLIEFLKKNLENKNIDIDKFLNPSQNDLRDPFAFKNMPLVVEKIKNAINDKKKILVYGDYDCDGVCASTILYLFFKEIGADVNVFIPNRFENGYGISVDAIEEIKYKFDPDLLITVDLGITAVEEVEILKGEGIDVIITDHHIPLEEVPDCLIIDPKLDVDYGFEGLCGAGVAFKLVEAMSNREKALELVDFAGIATVADIVPLIDENRAIVSLALDKINKNNCHKSISYFMKKLDLAKINSTDISFKFAPRINACGRMDSALKIFDFLVEDDEKKLEEKYLEVESDNTMRLSFIEKGIKEIEKELKNIDSDDMILIVKGDFHEGIIGILASRVVQDYNKPAIIFTKTENGTLKGSGRSVDGIDLHEIIASHLDSLVNFGGHKMAVGVEIEIDFFDEFRNLLNNDLKEKYNKNLFIKDDRKFDIEIFEDDLSNKFFNELNMLEPFGCENEKPILAIKKQALNVQRMSEKAFKHYSVFTEKNNRIVAFNAYNIVPILSGNSTKELIVDFSENTFRGVTKLNFNLKDVLIDIPDLSGTEEYDLMSSLYNLYYSIFDFNKSENYHLEKDLKNIIKTKFAENEFGTLVVCSTSEDLNLIKDLNLNKYFAINLNKNGQNTVLISPKGIYQKDNLKGYKNIIFLHKNFNNEHLYYSNNFNVYEPVEVSKNSINLSKERIDFVNAYKSILNYKDLKANDELDFVERLFLKDSTVSKAQLMFSLIVFMELNFFEFDKVLNSMVILKSKKMQLENSKMYNEVN